MNRSRIVCFDNDALIPELWARESVAILLENLVMANLVNRQFEPTIANFGDLVHTSKPGTAILDRASDDDDVSPVTTTTEDIQVPLNQKFRMSFKIKDGEASKSFKDLVTFHLAPRIQKMATGIDRVLTGQVHAFFANCVGRLGKLTSSTAMEYLTSAVEKLNINKAYVDGRNLVLAPTAYTALLQTDTLVEADKRGDQGSALRTASLGSVLGLDTYMSQNQPGITINATDNVAGVTSETGEIDEVELNCNVPAYVAVNGEFIVVDDEGQPHWILTSTNDATNTTAVTLESGLKYASASGDVLTVYKPCAATDDYDSGWVAGIVLDDYTNPPRVGQLLAFGSTVETRHTYTIVEVQAEDGTNCTVLLDRPLEANVANNALAYPGPAGSFNLAFHKNAITLVSRPMATPDASLGVRTAIATYGGVGMRITMQYDIYKEATIVVVSLLCGIKVLDTDLGVVLLG